MVRLSVVMMVLALAIATAGCGGSGGSSSSSAPSTTPAQSSTPTATAPETGVKITSMNVAGLGPVLVNAKRRTLYVFAPDKHSKVTCVSACASVWPPAFLPGGQKAVAAGSVKQSLLGSDPDPAGGSVVTYAHWPLYTYVSDTAPGQASGQALNLNGGLWYVISPSGKLITKKP